jgi:prepilin-type N-terminal cleavage/methylation domain-containing protein
VKKGFTLVELLAVIVILGILATFLVPSIFKMVRSARQNSYNVLMESFEENAKLYTSRHREEIENYLDQYNYYSFTLNDLKNDNLLKTPVTDPRTDEQIDLNKKIYIVRETDKTLSVCYEDRGCYAPIKLVDKVTDPTNIATGSFEGLHQDATNNFYYYAGNNPNNWVEFNGMLWRIVKVNSDNSIKIIYEGTKEGSGTTENGAISNGPFDVTNINNFDNIVTVKAVLQNWYDTNITANNKAKVLLTKWCNGKVTYVTTGVSKASFLSGECSTQTSGTYDIGLLSGSEYLYGSLDSSCLTAYKTTGDYGYTCKNQNYLYKNIYNYWTITPDNVSTNVWTVQSVGALGAPVTASSSNHIRPVITLRNDVYIDRGDGSIDTPYVIKDIISVDKINPVFTMLGSSPVNMYVGKSYTDVGATASDNIDGDITSKIITISNLNINVPGSYTVTYVVSDVSGNKTSIKRIINVIEQNENAPILAAGMTPIKWNGSDWVETTENDYDWYKYNTTDKKWANARTADGSMWVWIPRYIYKISSGWHTSNVGTIDVQFSKGTDDTLGSSISLVNTGAATDSNGTWTSHPAFTFGTTQLTGIWVAKFEASNDGISNVRVVPNVSSFKNINITDIFNITRSMEANNIYGWGTSGNGIDTHMMKNIEWGAVAYLSKSIYGKNAEIWINNSNTYITGCAGDNASDAASTTGCEYAYNTSNGLQASTTGNIYGIYDMSGGVSEYTSSYVDNGNAVLTSNGNSAYVADSKYKDVYTVAADDTEPNNYALAVSLKGDAIYETSSSGSGSTSWNSDYSYMARTDVPWFERGGYYSRGSGAGAFFFDNFYGVANSYYGFRPVLVVGAAL